MNLTLNYHEEFKDNLVEEKPKNGGVQYVFKFENGYGASVIKSFMSYGVIADLWELAVIYFRGKSYNLDYDTPITDDVLGWLTDDDVNELLGKIRDLPSRHGES